MFRKTMVILLILLIHLTLPFIHSCRMNPAPVSTVISGYGNLFAPTNGDTTFTFSGDGNTYGSFIFEAYQTYGLLKTPEGLGLQKGMQNLSIAPDSGYLPSEVCGMQDIAHYYYLVTDMGPHYAKVLILDFVNDLTGITIEFNWWLQTNDGDRNFQ
jgi:hypothetical protein